MKGRPMSLSSTQPTVLAFDPGGTTGWSLLTVPAKMLVSRECSLTKLFESRLDWKHGQICGPEPVQTTEMLRLCRLNRRACILVEDFTLRMFNQDKEILSPVRLTAMLDYALHSRYDTRTTFRQQPSEAMDVVTDAYLKQLGLYERKGGMGHARDADRHAVLWLRKAHDLRLGPARRHKWWPHLF